VIGPYIVGTFWVRWDAEGDTPPLDMGRGDGHPNYVNVHAHTHAHAQLMLKKSAGYPLCQTPSGDIPRGKTPSGDIPHSPNASINTHYCLHS
jgi:hypothetical protein